MDHKDANSLNLVLGKSCLFQNEGKRKKKKKVMKKRSELFTYYMEVVPGRQVDGKSWEIIKKYAYDVL